jgi:hypothetical protein
VFTGKLTPTQGQHKPARYDQERQLGLQICPDISPIIIITTTTKALFMFSLINE